MSEGLPRRGRVAGIDYGTVRVGIAITDPEQRLASPYENYRRQGARQDGERFRRLVEQEQVVGFVVGLPLHTSGEESQKSIEARQFGEWLRQVTGKPVCFFDERYTSVQAEQALLNAQLTRKKRRRRMDMLAAQIMLAAFLESPRVPQPEQKPLDD